MKPALNRRKPPFRRALNGTRPAWMSATMAALLFGIAVPASAAVTCTLSAPAMAFGPYDVFSGTQLTSSSLITVTCTLTGITNTTVSGSLAMSTGSSGTYIQRTMKAGVNSLGYNLYTSSALTTVWGDGTGATDVIAGSVSLTTSARVQTVTVDVFGAVPPLQDAKVGTYTDNVTMTVSY